MIWPPLKLTRCGICCRCIFAAGSPFDAVEYEGKKIVQTQANNVLVSSGLGFGAVIVKAKTIT